MRGYVSECGVESRDGSVPEVVSRGDGLNEV
jgi:hypothetical protein